MKQSRRHHSPEFKREAVALVVEHGYSCAAAGRSLGVSGTLVRRWKVELGGPKGKPFPATGTARPSSSGFMPLKRRIVGCGWSEKS